MFCLLISLLSTPTTSLSQCSTALFPLIFGGSGGDSTMKTFDLWQVTNSYKIVAGGFTNDKTLAATATSDYYPIIIMYAGSL